MPTFCRMSWHANQGLYWQGQEAMDTSVSCSDCKGFHLAVGADAITAITCSSACLAHAWRSCIKPCGPRLSSLQGTGIGSQRDRVSGEPAWLKLGAAAQRPLGLPPRHVRLTALVPRFSHMSAPLLRVHQTSTCLCCMRKSGLLSTPGNWTFTEAGIVTS